MSEDGTIYAFLPTTRIVKDEIASVPDLAFHRHPRNFWLIPGMMIPTVLEKLYPLTEAEKQTKRRIECLREEKESLESELADIENKIEDLEQELTLDPDREIQYTWSKGLSPEGALV